MNKSVDARLFEIQICSDPGNLHWKIRRLSRLADWAIGRLGNSEINLPIFQSSNLPFLRSAHSGFQNIDMRVSFIVCDVHECLPRASVRFDRFQQKHSITTHESS
jgi:hypothetical protein